MERQIEDFKFTPQERAEMPKRPISDEMRAKLAAIREASKAKPEPVKVV